MVLSETCEMLTLCVEDFDSIKNKFPRLFRQLFSNAAYKCGKLINIKEFSIKEARTGYYDKELIKNF